MSFRRPAPIALALILIVAPAGVRGQSTEGGSQMHDVLAAYLSDPAGNAKALVSAAAAAGGPLDPVSAWMVGDAALRTGLYRTATEYFAMVREAGGTPEYTSAAEIGLAWAALGRGRLTDASQHMENVAETTPALQPFAETVLALIGAASGSPDSYATLAELAARPDADPAFRQMGPLLEAYARYWSGDLTGAADAFTAFAVANPDSRFTDDALYAAAQAKQRLGRDAEAQADFEALAADDKTRGRLSSRLMALDGRALLREGMRRDRAQGTRLLPQRVADLFDGDGGRLARAALAARARAREAAASASEATDGHAATPGRSSGARAGTPLDAERAVGSDRDAPPAAPTRSSATHGAKPEGGLLGRAQQSPWSVALIVAGALLLLALWRLGRGRAQGARSR